MKKYLFFFVFSFGLVAGQQDNPFYGENNDSEVKERTAQDNGPGNTPGDGDPVPIDNYLGYLLVVALAATYYYGRKLHPAQSKN